MPTLLFRTLMQNRLENRWPFLGSLDEQFEKNRSAMVVYIADAHIGDPERGDMHTIAGNFYPLIKSTTFHRRPQLEDGRRLEQYTISKVLKCSAVEP